MEVEDRGDLGLCVFIVERGEDEHTVMIRWDFDD